MAHFLNSNLGNNHSANPCHKKRFLGNEGEDGKTWREGEISCSTKSISTFEKSFQNSAYQLKQILALVVEMEFFISFPLSWVRRSLLPVYMY